MHLKRYYEDADQNMQLHRFISVLNTMYSLATNVSQHMILFKLMHQSYVNAVPSHGMMGNSWDLDFLSAHTCHEP